MQSDKNGDSARFWKMNTNGFFCLLGFSRQAPLLPVSPTETMSQISPVPPLPLRQTVGFLGVLRNLPYGHDVAVKVLAFWLMPETAPCTKNQIIEFLG